MDRTCYLPNLSDRNFLRALQKRRVRGNLWCSSEHCRGSRLVRAAPELAGVLQDADIESPQAWERTSSSIRVPTGTTDTGQPGCLQHRSEIPTLMSKHTEVLVQRVESSYNILPTIKRISKTSVADKTFSRYSASQETSIHSSSSQGERGKGSEWVREYSSRQTPFTLLSGTTALIRWRTRWA